MTTLGPHNSGDLEGQTEARKPFPNFLKLGKNDDGDHPQVQEERRREAAGYGDSSATYWELYVSEAEINDQKLVDTLTSDMTAISILNGIFSSIIASFIVQTSQALQPNNSSQETVCLLSELVSQGNSLQVTQQSSQYCPDPSFSGNPSGTIIRSNILLLVSFFLAMMSVLACGLIQQWCHEYMKYAYPRGAPHKRGRVRTYLFRGLNRFYIRRFMYAVHAVLHLSVLLFFCGVSDYLHSLHPTVGLTSWYCVLASVLVYVALGISPLIIGYCPYQTALTPPLLFGSTLLLSFCRTAWRRLRHGQNGTFPRCDERHFNKRRYLMEQADAKAADLDSYAINWLFTDDDFDDADMDKFLEAFPGYLHSRITIREGLAEVLTASHIFRRIRAHLMTCATEIGLSEQARVKRVSACVNSLRLIVQLRKNSEDEEKLLTEEMQSIIDDFNGSCGTPEEKRDIRAFCVRALAYQDFLTKCLEPPLSPLERASEGSPEVKVPGHLTPLYTFLSSSVNMSQRPQQASTGVSDEKVPENDKISQTLLHDGLFINLTLLARAILSHEDIDPARLSLCWKTLDILRSEFRITRVDVSASSLAFFNEIHEQTRNRVDSDEPGFSVVPLLEILDAVDGGRRLSMVFQDHPNPKYRNKAADLAFGKDHLRNPDLFRAFANCLPHFVAENLEKSLKLMEGLVCYDHLWISLQVHLSNSLRPNNFATAMMRTFDTCCTVIDAAFVALENSQKVDWRAPDFGSLAHYFELYVTDCFQGMFIERDIGFRVGLIKARFCRAVLTQFLDEFRSEGTVVFRSHWDVASLARVFYSLGVGDDADMEFWKSYVDGGPIGDVLMAKTYTTLDMAERDGPLLNFCKLGQLGMMAVPFEGSGLTETDFRKLLDLMQTMADDKRLPLTRSSIRVWEELRQLRAEVAERTNNEDQVIDIIYERSSKVDNANMKALLEKIDLVCHHRPSSAQEYPPVDHAQTQGSGPLPVVQPDPSSRGSVDHRFSFSTASTAVTEDRHDSSAAQEVDFRRFTPARSNTSCGALANVYRNPYPILPTQIDHSGAITRPFSASFLPNLFPHSGHTDIVFPGVPSAHPPLWHMRYNSQHHRASVYYRPKVDTPSNRSATLLSRRSPARILSANASNEWFGPSSSNVVYSSAPIALRPADEADAAE